MRNLKAEIRKTDIENRRYYIWANIAAFGLVVLMAAFLLISNGGAPQSDEQAATTPPAPSSQTQPSG